MSQSAAIRRSASTPADLADPRWKDLYRVGGYTSIVLFIIPLIAVTAYFIWPYIPGEAPLTDIYALVQENPLGAFFALDTPVLIGALFTVSLVVALYAALKSVNESYALLALVLGVLATAALIPMRPVTEIVALSNLYTAAETVAAQERYLAAGEALIQTFHGSAWLVYMALTAISFLISTMLMLQSDLFPRPTAYVGIVANLLIAGIFVPAVGTLLLFGGTLVGMVWSIQLARNFLRLARQ